MLIVSASLLVSHKPIAAPWSRQEEPLANTQPAENLLLIVADIQRHINDDVYRFPYPLDANGQNVFRASIVRLSNYERIYPGRLKEVVALAKAQAFEKLCAFQEAGANYQAAQKSGDERIKKVAGEGFERMKQFSSIVDVIPDKSTPRTWERDIRTRIAELSALVKTTSLPHVALLQVERERAQMQLAEFYKAVRFIRPYSMKDLTNQLKENVEVNKASKMLYTHHLMQADLQFELAKEYTVLNDPEGPDFDLRDFEGFTKSARAEYAIVEQADGFDEKQEGRAKLQALDAFVERVTDRAR
ncbi:MAG: hypothetical protein ACR2IE_01500 [Candidatus Sumerlaeaceae bacterium]